MDIETTTLMMSTVYGLLKTVYGLRFTNNLNVVKHEQQYKIYIINLIQMV